MLGDFPINDKIVAITGGGSGIGLSFVKQAASLNARVIIGDLKLTTEAETLVQKDPKNLVFVKCDVTRRANLQSLIDAAVKQFGDVPDVYVACAGVFEMPTFNFWDDTEDDRYRTLDVNAQHPIKFTRLAMRALLSRNKKGVVLIVSSIAGLIGSYGVPIYCASKHAVVGFVKSMSGAEEHLGIKVVGVMPGVVATPLWTKDAMATFKYNPKEALSSDDIAISMKNLVQKGKYPGGTLLYHDAARTQVFSNELGGRKIEPTPEQIQSVEKALGKERPGSKI